MTLNKYTFNYNELLQNNGCDVMYDTIYDNRGSIVTFGLGDV